MLCSIFNCSECPGFLPLGNDAYPHVGAPSACWRKPKDSEQEPSFSAARHHCHKLTSPAVLPAQSGQADWQEAQSAAHTRLGGRGVGNRCAGLVGHWQLLPHQHSNQHRVPPALMSLRQQFSPGSSGGFPGAHGDPGLLRREGLPGL